MQASQATLFPDHLMDGLTVLKPRRAALPLPQKASDKAIKKAQQQAIVDAKIDTCAHWFGVLFEFNDLARTGKKKKGNYARAVSKFGEAFDALTEHLKPAEIISLCMAQLNEAVDTEDENE